MLKNCMLILWHQTLLRSCLTLPPWIYLMILTGKKCFTQFSTRMAASDLFHMFKQSIKFYTFYYHVFKSTDVWKMRFTNGQ